jgi:hypothetical protein
MTSDQWIILTKMSQTSTRLVSPVMVFNRVS